MTISTPPKDSELELSVFGRGFGECLVIHLGHDNWMVVDSCQNRSRTGPVALEYLKLLGVDISSKVKLVVVTHWHDDHIEGMGELVEKAVSSEVVWSAALRTDEAMILVEAASKSRFVAHSSMTREFVEILDALRSRQHSKKGPHHWACHCMALFKGDRVEVWALSPSAQAMTDAKVRMAAMLPAKMQSTERFPEVTQNDASIVLQIKTEYGTSMLLGGDLEWESNNDRGWQAIIGSALRSETKSAAYKIAHHGSPNADHDDIWQQLLQPNAFAFVTPYSRGRKPRPSKEDIDRVRGRTNRAFCTSSLRYKKPPRRGSSDKTINEVTLSRRTLLPDVGHVRLRIAMDPSSADKPNVELFNGAFQL